MSFDSEETRLADRIQATAFFQAREAGASFITKKWVANRLKRSEEWVKQNGRKKPIDCEKWGVISFQRARYCTALSNYRAIYAIRRRIKFSTR